MPETALRSGPSVADLLPDLRLAVEQIAARVLTEVRRVGGEIEGRAPDGGKVGIVARGHKLGVWQNFGSGAAGDIFELIRLYATGGDGRAALRWALPYWHGYTGKPPPPQHAIRTANPLERTPRGPARDSGKGLWLASRPMTPENPVGQYLRGRGVPLAEPMPAGLGALRYAPALWCHEVRHHVPAMLAAVVNPISGEYVTTHRTYLHQHWQGWRKAPLETPKKVMSSPIGGLIPLGGGGTRRSLPKAMPGSKLLLAEGIENALCVGIGMPEYRCAAYVAAPYLLHLDLPESFETVCLIRDRDGENRAVRDTREQAIAWWREEGRTVEEWEPPAEFKDAADFFAALERNAQ